MSETHEEFLLKYNKATWKEDPLQVWEEDNGQVLIRFRKTWDKFSSMSIQFIEGYWTLKVGLAPPIVNEAFKLRYGKYPFIITDYSADQITEVQQFLDLMVNKSDRIAKIAVFL